MNNCKNRLDYIIQNRNLPQMLENIEKNIIKEQILDDLKSERECAEFAKSILTGTNCISSDITISSKKDNLEQELQQLKSQNQLLSEEKNKIFEEIMQIRLNLITKISL